jgi:protein gp37
MADLFHEAVPDEFLDSVFEVLERVPRHIYQILTKRPGRARVYMGRRYGNALAPEHIWIGTSVEDQRVLDRLEELRATPARVRFLSCEPLIGPLTEMDLSGIHWVIAGGESGRRRRPIDGDWVRELREKCLTESVAFFFKQWGGLTPKAGGRELDGRTWDDYPKVSVSPSPAARRARRHPDLGPRPNAATPYWPAAR